MKFEIIFYKKADGTSPVREFIYSLEPSMQAKSLRAIDLLETNGNLMREPMSKALRNGIFELRVKFGSDISRVLYFFFVGRKIILTNGFIKKTQKTPAGQIELAEAYRKDYIERTENNE